jgi:hypothetical protein
MPGGRPKGDPNHQRRGKGSWGPGAPARAFSADYQPPPEAKAAGHDIARAIRERIAARKDEILSAQLARATDPAHPQGHQAAADLLNRVMPPESKVQVSSVALDQMTDEELAAIARGGSGAPAGAATD